MSANYFLQTRDGAVPDARLHLHGEYDEERYGDSRWDLPADMGAGQVQFSKLMSGMELWVVDGCFAPGTRILSDEKEAILSFGFVLEGSARGRYGGQSIEVRSGQQSIFFSPDQKGEGYPAPGAAFRHVSLHCRPEMFVELAGADVERFPLLERLARNRQVESYAHVAGMSAVVAIRLQQMLQCPYAGFSRQLFLESCAFELIAHQLELIAIPEQLFPARKTERLRRDEIARIEHVRQLLLADLENPPGLRELALAAGMSHPKLSRGFKQLYGSTPFAYLRRERLAEARTMLCEQNLSVTETAYAVGYSSLSHFSKAYKQHFGELPGISAKAS